MNELNLSKNKLNLSKYCNLRDPNTGKYCRRPEGHTGKHTFRGNVSMIDRVKQ